MRESSFFIRLYVNFAFLVLFLFPGCDWPLEQPLRCGDGARAVEEVCDGKDLGGMTCQKVKGKGWQGGTLTCAANCQSMDDSGCYKCGDGVKNGKEACDGLALGGLTCQKVKGKGWQGGTLTCAADCAKLDESGCYKCGDGKVNGNEFCDPQKAVTVKCTELASLDYSTGSLKCKGDCSSYDTSGCKYVCGDNKRNGKEFCDGTDLAGLTCETIPGAKYNGGQLKCLKNCSYLDVAGCSYCGDAKKNSTKETCDGADLGGKTCKDLKGAAGVLFKRGKLACKTDCGGYDTSQCTYWDVDYVTVGGSTSNDRATGVSVDSLGNSYITGSFAANGLTLGKGTYTKGMCNYQPGMFVAKLTGSGVFDWDVTAAPCYVANPVAVGTDKAGNIYSTGFFKTWFYFWHQQSYSVTANGTYTDIYVIKQQPGSKPAWIKSAGSSGIEVVEDMAVDHLGNVYITGRYSASAGSKFGTITIKGKYNPGPQSGWTFNAFVAKMNSKGDFLWAKSLGGPGDTFGTGVALDGAFGDVFITGYFRGQAGFGSTTFSSKGIKDLYVARLDSKGNFKWAKSAGGAGDESGTAIAVDSLGHAVVAGQFGSSITLGSTTLKSKGDRDAMVFKLDGTGKVVWAKSMGGANTDEALDVTIDSKGNALVTGYFTGKATFPGQSLTAMGGKDMFLSKLSPKGSFLWTATGGGMDSDEGLSVVVDSSDRAVVSGGGSVPFQFGDKGAKGYGFQDAFVVRISSSL